ncbi:uncharacterized protein LOC135480860 [Liolophura sinensis]|uniref:uncharacterized protein LOC135480860 n=1 Tax=Liolophura sinensis TaxID=3198878 RepID=UPI0031590793
MLELAKAKGFYQNYFCNFIEETQGIIEDETFDIACSLGGIRPGHLESAAAGQMFRVTKPGGLICISGVKERWDGDPDYHQRMRSVIAEVEALNKTLPWEAVQTEAAKVYKETGKSPRWEAVQTEAAKGYQETGESPRVNHGVSRDTEKYCWVQ